MNPDRRDIRTICPNCFSTLDKSGFCFRCRKRLGALSSPQLALQPRTILKERYMVGRPLGMGGFGMTYLAWDRYTSTKVAVKEFFPKGYTTRIPMTDKVTVLQQTYAASFKQWLAAFIQETQMLTNIHRMPGVVRILDFFQANNTAYIVMEYLEGVSLRNYMIARGGRLSINETLSIMRPVLDSLSVLHQYGVIHKDISPENIQIVQNKFVKLIDFGAASFNNQDIKKPYFVLKKGFSPIELYSTQIKQGPWSDIYEVGATIYNCLTGVIPPEAPQRMQRDLLYKPSAYGVSIPVARENSLMKSLQRMPEQRYSNVGDFIQMLYGAFAAVKRP